MAKKTVISSQSSSALVTLTQNVVNAGVPIPIFRLTVPRGALYGLSNFTQVGNRRLRGAHFILDLNKADGSRISGGSEIAFGFRKPSGENIQWFRKLPYSIWRELTSKDQQDENFIPSLVAQTDLNVPKEGLGLPEQYEFYIGVNGPDQVDWSKSYAQFSVDEVN